MRKDIKIYSGVCEACTKESKYMQRDHRIPVRFGGAQDQSNFQDLCLECHKRKSALECSLFSFNGTTETIREWYELAFQNDNDRIKAFVDHVALRIDHFREVQNERFTPVPRAPARGNLAFFIDSLEKQR